MPEEPRTSIDSTIQSLIEHICQNIFETITELNNWLTFETRALSSISGYSCFKVCFNSKTQVMDYNNNFSYLPISLSIVHQLQLLLHNLYKNTRRGD